MSRKTPAGRMTLLAASLAVQAALGMATAESAAAQPAGPPPPDPTYPAASLLDPLGGPLADAADPKQALHALETGVRGAARVVERTQTLLEPADPSAPGGGGGPSVAAQRVLDSATHAHPTVLGVSLLGTANPYFLPDWNHDRVFGNAPDYDLDNSDRPARASFRYPCIALDGRVTYETTRDACLPSDATGARFRLGEARRLRIVNSRGIELAATLWLPDLALRPGAGSLPGVVFANGFSSRQANYYMYPMTLARAGFIALTFDEAGQGDSEGSGADLFFAPPVENCSLPGACRDLQDALRWFTGARIEPVAGPGAPLVPRLAPRRSPAYRPEGANPRNPVLSLLDTSRIGIIGQSMGSMAVTSYLHHLSTGSGAEGRRLPGIGAAIALSGVVPLRGSAVPLQAQTSDYDLPGFTAENGLAQATDGPVGLKAWYDQLRATRTGRGALEIIVIEGGSHTDTTNANGTPRAVWAAALSTSYAADWFGCHLGDEARSCRLAVAPRPHLSRIAASEHDPDGPAGPTPSRCITTPDRASLAQAPNPPMLVASLLSRPRHDCQP